MDKMFNRREFIKTMDWTLLESQDLVESIFAAESGKEVKFFPLFLALFGSERVTTGGTGLKSGMDLDANFCDDHKTPRRVMNSIQSPKKKKKKTESRFVLFPYSGLRVLKKLQMVHLIFS